MTLSSALLPTEFVCLGKIWPVLMLIASPL